MDDGQGPRRRHSLGLINSSSLKPRRHLSTLAALAFCLLWLRSTGPLSWLKPSAPPPPPPGPAPGTADRCNPFHQRGYLHVDRSSIDENYWSPYDRSCPPSRLFRVVREDALSDPSSPLRLPWLVNRTVALVGDSVDRAHIRHFCDLVSSPFHNVSDAAREGSPSSWGMPSASYVVPWDSPVSPKPYLHPLDKSGGPANWPPGVYEEHKARWPTTHSNLNRPWVCRVERYSLTIVWVFTWGMDPPFEGIQFARDADFHPPSSIPLRIEHILFPLLDNLALAYSQPAMAQPDLVEMSSGPWDARSWTQLDIELRGESFAEDNPTVFEPSRAWQRERWARGMRDSVRKVATRFPRAGILWRSLHHPGKHYYVPWNKMFQIDELARYTLSNLVSESLAPPSSSSSSYQQHPAGADWHPFASPLRHPLLPRALTSPFSRSRRKTFHGPTRDPSSSSSPQHAPPLAPPATSPSKLDAEAIQDAFLQGPGTGRGYPAANGWMKGLGLEKRLRMDEWGHKMMGMQHTFVDPIHPGALPGSVLWADMMLWELRESVEATSN